MGRPARARGGAAQRPGRAAGVARPPVVRARTRVRRGRLAAGSSSAAGGGWWARTARCSPPPPPRSPSSTWTRPRPTRRRAPTRGPSRGGRRGPGPVRPRGERLHRFLPGLRHPRRVVGFLYGFVGPSPTDSPRQGFRGTYPSPTCDPRNRRSANPLSGTGPPAGSPGPGRPGDGEAVMGGKPNLRRKSIGGSARDRGWGDRAGGFRDRGEAAASFGGW